MTSFDDGSQRIDFEQQVVTFERMPVELSPVIYSVLATLVRHKGQVLSSEALMELAWGGPSAPSAQRMQYVVQRLRIKLGWDGVGYTPIETVAGLGYRYRSRP